MMKKSKLIAIILCILLVEKSKSEYHLPAVVIPPKPGAAEGTAACPSVKKVKEVQNIIIDNLNFTLVCGYGPWYPVAHINMSDPVQRCPSNWFAYSSNGVRACSRRPSSTTGLIASCDGVFFFVGRQYNKICGRILGYQLGSVDAFSDPTEDPRFTPTARAIDRTIDGAYVDGVSITHGSPRNHIWTFAAGGDPKSLNYTCPCIQGYTGPGQQSFVGDHYFCESAGNDKLWDGQQCSENGTCCDAASPLPWFVRELPSPTSDDIEVRICGDESTDNEDTPVELVEIYVQ